MQDHYLPKVICQPNKEVMERTTKEFDKQYSNINLGQFKNKYYKLALEDVFDVDDPRTWKSICLSCNKSRNLSCQISCCCWICVRCIVGPISIVHGAAVIGENCRVHPANGTHIIQVISCSYFSQSALRNGCPNRNPF